MLPHSVDRFASVVNKISRFNSLFWNPSSESVDALTQNWSGENNFLVPPLYYVVRAIKHLVYSKAIGTLIIPRWVSAPYWINHLASSLTAKTGETIFSVPIIQ
jgi:hypothetical protein